MESVADQLLNIGFPIPTGTHQAANSGTHPAITRIEWQLGRTNRCLRSTARQTPNIRTKTDVHDRPRSGSKTVGQRAASLLL